MLAATNRPDLLDARCCGRAFDRLVYLGPPEGDRRLRVLRALTAASMADGVDLEAVAARPRA